MGASHDPGHHREGTSARSMENLNVEQSIGERCARCHIHATTEELAIGDDNVDGFTLESVTVYARFDIGLREPR